MDLDDNVPLLVGHAGKALVAEDPRVVDEYVEAAKVVNGRLDDRFAVLDRRRVDDGLAARRLDFGDHLLGRLLVHVVDNDRGAELGVHGCVGLAEAVAGARDEGDLALEVDGGFRLLVARELLCLLEKLHVIGVRDVLWMLDVAVIEVDDLSEARLDLWTTGRPASARGTYQV